jgi:hypothetical protein
MTHFPYLYFLYKSPCDVQYLIRHVCCGTADLLDPQAAQSKYRFR